MFQTDSVQECFSLAETDCSLDGTEEEIDLHNCASATLLMHITVKPVMHQCAG